MALGTMELEGQPLGPEFFRELKVLRRMFAYHCQRDIWREKAQGTRIVKQRLETFGWKEEVLWPTE